MFPMMPWPLSSSFTFLPPDIFLQGHMTAGQNAPQRSLSSQQEAAIRMLFTRPLQQVLEKEEGVQLSKCYNVTLVELLGLSLTQFNSNFWTNNYLIKCFLTCST